MPPLPLAYAPHEFRDLAQDRTVAGSVALLRAAERLTQSLAEALCTTGLCLEGVAAKEAQLFVGGTYTEVLPRALDNSLDTMFGWTLMVEQALASAPVALEHCASPAKSLLTTLRAYPGIKRLRVAVAGQYQQFDLPESPLAEMPAEAACLVQLQLAMASLGSAVLYQLPSAAAGVPTAYAVLLAHQTGFALPPEQAARLLRRHARGPLHVGTVEWPCT